MNLHIRSRAARQKYPLGILVKGALGNLTDVNMGSKHIHYLYDGQNRLVGKEVNGVLTEGFLYDRQLEPVAELGGSGNIVEQFVYGARQNVPDYIVKGGVEYEVITDQAGSPELIVDASTGAIAEQISYDAWGNVTSDSNPGFQPFGFAGGLYDRDTGLVHFGARDYDPETGRWISKDPILFAGGYPNLYGYVLNDPINVIDATGLCPNCEAKFIKNNYPQFLAQHVIPNFSLTSYWPTNPNFKKAIVTTGEIGIVKGGLLFGGARFGKYLVSKGIQQGAILETGVGVVAEGIAVLSVGLSAFSTTAEILAYLHYNGP